MDSAQLIDKLANVEQLLDNKQLLDALAELKNITTFDDTLSYRCKNLEEGYRSMLSYVSRGVEDSQRGNYYNDFLCYAYTILDKCRSEVNKKSEKYFNSIRYQFPFPQNIYTAIGIYNQMINNIDNETIELTIRTDSGEIKQPYKNTQENREVCENVIFTSIWNNFPIEVNDFDALNDFLLSGKVSANVLIKILPALLLSNLQFFDAQKNALLFETYRIYINTPDANVAMVALACAILSLLHNSSRPITGNLKKHIHLAAQCKTWEEDVRLVLFELVKPTDTKRINKKINDEIIPELKKMQNDINSFFSSMNIDESTFDIQTIEENPEWLEKMQESKFANKMQEMFKLQKEGTDIYMSTFKQLKFFPFFNVASNWFAPFDSSNSFLKGNDVARSLNDLFKTAPGLCDSDKYSIALLYNGQFISDDQKNAISNQLKLSKMGLEEYSAIEIPQEDVKRLAVNNFVFNLYRFAYLFRGAETVNPFEKSIDISNCSATKLFAAKDGSDILMISEFYFKHKYYGESLPLMLYLEKNFGVSVEILQKIGYCYQIESNFSKALDYYKKAELQESNSKWTINKIVQCLQSLGKHQEALEYIEDLLIMEPDNINALLCKANSLASLDRYEQAIPVMQKVDYLQPNNEQAQLFLANCCFRKHDYDAALNYMKKGILSNPTAEKYIFMGNIYLALHNIPECITSYELAAERHSEGTAGIIKAVNKSKPELMSYKIDINLLPMILDCVARI